MNSKIGHVYLYVTDIEKSYKFYSELLSYLDYKETVKEGWGFCYLKDGTSLWFEKTPQDHCNDGYNRRRTGLNHIAFRVESKTDVDTFYEHFLKSQRIKPLYESPKAYPEYDPSYYAVYFVDPNGIKLEVTYYE